MPDPIWTPQLTQDGSFTFFSTEFGETFHSTQGAKAEAFAKFSDVTDLRQKAQNPSLCLLDICYGLGYNSAAALETIWQVNPQCQVFLYGLEIDATVPLGAIAPQLLQAWSLEVQIILTALAHQHCYLDARCHAQLLIGDARQTVQRLIHADVPISGQQPWQADAIFFDPFSPRRCPQLWTVEFFQQVARCLNPEGKLATYSRSASVRAALSSAGFYIGTIPLNDSPYSHEWSQGTVAAHRPNGLQTLSVMEQEHLQTRAAIPYRDPQLTDGATEILTRQKAEQARSPLESTSSWRRRWGIR
jgi:tRNA U34 5-methylaminomethyl-2-thiouridine-forming methyltransferase MnmC